MSTMDVNSLPANLPAAVGHRVWAIGDGWIPPTSSGAPGMISHESVCILNAGLRVAQLELWFYFTEREPLGPLRVTIAGQRVRHIVINDADLPEPVPHGVDYSIVVTSTEPVVVQHTRMDTRQEANSMMSTIAYGTDG